MFKVYICLVPEDIETIKTLQEKFGVEINKDFLKNIIYAIHEECYPTSKPIMEYYRRYAKLFFGDELYGIIYRIGPEILEVKVSDDGVITIWVPHFC